jgi:histidinol-phosphate aminotransferase
LLARGIVVRDVSHYTKLAGCLRITIGTPAENDAVLAALDDLSTVSPQPSL